MLHQVGAAIMLNLLGEAGGAAPTQAKIQAALQVCFHCFQLLHTCALAC